MDGIIRSNISADHVIDGTTNKAYPAADKTKLAGIATGATANDTDANLKARTNHTGTQSADTITDGSTNKAYTATEKTKLAAIGASANTVWVSHGASTSVTRPTSASFVIWVGSVTPANALDGDVWINTA